MNGVVLDLPRAEAILYFAYKEGLVREDASKTDGFLASIVRKFESANPYYVQGIKESAFEQLVLCQTVYAPFRIPKGVYGSIFDDGIFKLVDLQSLNNDNITFQKIDLGIWADMLKSRGINMDESEIERRFNECKGAYNDFLNVSNGVFPNELNTIFADVIDDFKIDKRLCSLPEWEIFKQTEKRLYPIIIKVLDEYKKYYPYQVRYLPIVSFP